MTEPCRVLLFVKNFAFDYTIFVCCLSDLFQKEKIEMSTDIALTASTVDLDYILMQLDTISEILDQLEGVSNSNDLS